jgi:hypothetical protein
VKGDVSVKRNAGLKQNRLAWFLNSLWMYTGVTAVADSEQYRNVMNHINILKT